MRTFDLWSRYLDNDNHPLHGCVHFVVNDGNTSAPIYDKEGTPLNNPQLTDVYGRTQHQVFIEEDVIAYFYKYIGNGQWYTEENIDPSDYTKWELQYTAANELERNIHITSDSPVAINTIQDLRDVDPELVPDVNGVKIITLLGYNEVGDKEPINYIFAAPSYYPDDSGSVIQSNVETSGQWIMVQPTEHCDSRHFGAFPQNSYNTPDQTYQITKLFEYCQLHNIRPYFNGSDDYRWFRYSNLNVIANDIDISTGTKFYDAGSNNTIQGNWHDDPFFYNINTNVVAENVKASWHAKTYTNAKNVIIDEITEQKNWQDAHIDVRVSPLFGYNFTHCTFEDNGNIGSDNANGINNTFTNCKLNERMFITSGDYKVSLVNLCTNCQLDMDDFRNNMWLYKQIRQTMDGDAFFDFRNFPNVGRPIDNWIGNKIQSDTIWITNMKNLFANRYTLNSLNGQVVSYVLENCTGYYDIPARMNVTLIDCNVKLRLGQSCVISARNSEITLDSSTQDLYCPTISLRNSTLSGEHDGNYRWTSFTSYNSIIMCANEAKDSVVKDSQINAELRLIATPGTSRTVTYLSNTVTVSHFIHSYIDNNIFNGPLVIDGESALTLYGANQVLVDPLIIQNNRSNLANNDAWTITRLGAMASDALNYYTFNNNTGGFECTLDMHQVPIIPGGTLITSSYNGMLTETLGQLVESIRWGTNISQDPDNPSYADTMQNYFTKMRMFVIGLYDATVNLEFSLIDNPGAGGQRQGGDPIYLSPNVNYVAEGGTVYNYVASIYGPSTVQCRLSTYSKYQAGTLDNSHNFVVPDLARDPYSSNDQWQIRNFILGKGPGWFTGVNVNCSLRIRQLDKK